MAFIDDRLLDVDKHGVLRTPPVLWFALALLCRYWILVAVVFASARRAPDVVRILGDGFSWYFLLLEIPAVVLVVAAARRRPEAGKLCRWVWRNARIFVAGAVLAHLGATVWLLWSADVWRRWPELFLLSCNILDLAILVSVLRDDYYRQLFSDFPLKQPVETFQ
ncbi:MAG: DUF2919 family protein [Ramlibacter sp.]